MISYQQKLESIPAPGGNGCHVALLGIANQGLYEGFSEAQIFADIRNHIPIGTRKVGDREIQDAIQRAKIDYPQCSCFFKRFTRQPVMPKIRSDYLQRLIRAGQDAEEVDLWESIGIFRKRSLAHRRLDRFRQ